MNQEEERAVSWLKKWWWAVTAGLTGGFGLLVGLLARRRGDTEPATLPEGPSPVAVKAEEAVTKEAEVAEEQKQRTEVAAERAHDEEVGALVVEQEKKADELVENPDDLNAFMKEAGKGAREP